MFWRVWNEVFVINQRQRFNRNRVGNQFAVIAYGIGERIEFVTERFIWGDFSQQARLSVAAKTVMCPEDDVRAIASRGNLWELLFQFVRVLNGDFDTGVFLEFLPTSARPL